MTAPRPPHLAASTRPYRRKIGRRSPTRRAGGVDRCSRGRALLDPRCGRPSQKHGNPNTIGIPTLNRFYSTMDHGQQTVKPCINVLTYCLLCVLLSCCTWWVGRWVGCCTCCCFDVAVVLLYMVDAGGWAGRWVGHGRIRIITVRSVFCPYADPADEVFLSIAAAAYH